MGTTPKAARALKFFTIVKLIAITSISLVTALCADAKTWRNAQGTKSFEGEFVSRTANAVTIRFADNKTTTITFDKLHDDDRFWLDCNHPSNTRTTHNPVNIFDQLLFGDNRKQVEEKLKASNFAKLTVDETFLGRSGLNGVFRTTEKIGGLDALLFFDWSNEDSLSEVNLHTDPQPLAEAAQALDPCWMEFAKLLSKLYGKPSISTPELNISSVPDGAYQPTHLWNLGSQGSVSLGASREGNTILIVCRFSAKKTNPVEVTK